MHHNNKLFVFMHQISIVTIFNNVQQFVVHTTAQYISVLSSFTLLVWMVSKWH